MTLGFQSTSSDHSQWRFPSSPSRVARMLTTRSKSENSNRCGVSASRSFGPISGSASISRNTSSMTSRSSLAESNEALMAQLPVAGGFGGVLGVGRRGRGRGLRRSGRRRSGRGRLGRRGGLLAPPPASCRRGGLLGRRGRLLRRRALLRRGGFFAAAAGFLATAAGFVATAAAASWPPPCAPRLLRAAALRAAGFFTAAAGFAARRRRLRGAGRISSEATREASASTSRRRRLTSSSTRMSSSVCRTGPAAAAISSTISRVRSRVDAAPSAERRPYARPRCERRRGRRLDALVVLLVLSSCPSSPWLGNFSSMTHLVSPRRSTFARTPTSPSACCCPATPGARCGWRSS